MQPVKGMRDFFPEEMKSRSWLFAKFHETARRFNFHEYDACLLEHEELYIRKAGDEISDQLYSFSDKGGRRVALRPELTPSLARMVISLGKQAVMPIRWYSVGQCFRYERMQKGRKREHYQWNMDIVGDSSVAAELDLLASLVDFFESVGLTASDIVIRLSNRKLLSEILDRAGTPTALLPQVSVTVDKLDKMPREEVSKSLRDIGLGEQTVEAILALTGADSVEDIERTMGFSPSAAAEIRLLWEHAEAYGIASYLEFSPSLVRGLSYYTGTVFEAYERGGKGRAVCGGGRYDRLIETFGGSPTPMVGFGFGDVMISLLLAERGLFPGSLTEPKVLVVAFSEAESSAALGAAARLRSADVRSELDLSFRKLRKHFSRADREGFSHVVVAAPEEVAQGKLLVKDLAEGTESRPPAERVADVVRADAAAP